MKDTPSDLVESVEELIDEVQTGVEQELAPYRRSIWRRYPTLFLLAVTFGVSLVFYSIEVILTNNAFVQQYPLVTLGIGLLVLVITGTLYKKLD